MLWDKKISFFSWEISSQSVQLGKQFVAFRKHFLMESFQWKCSDQFQAHQSVSKTHACFSSEFVFLWANLGALLPHAINAVFSHFCLTFPLPLFALSDSFFPPLLTCHFTPCAAPQDTQHGWRTGSWEPQLNLTRRANRSRDVTQVSKH